MKPIINTNCSIHISQVDEVCLWLTGCDEPFFRFTPKSELEQLKEAFNQQGYSSYFLTTKAPEYFKLSGQHIWCLE